MLYERKKRELERIMTEDGKEKKYFRKKSVPSELSFILRNP